MKLRPGALAALMVVTGAVRVTADPGPDQPDQQPPVLRSPAGSDPSGSGPAAKKDRELATKSPHHRAPPPRGTRPAKLINLNNQWTNEWLAIDPTAPPDRAVIDHFLRDHFTNSPSAMDPRLIDIVAAAAIKFNSDTAVVVSGYRHPKYNLILRKKGHQVARDSQHTHGNAIDFYIPRIPTLTLHAWAKAQLLGGVGLYPESNFVHMDTGKIRYWTGE